MSAEETNITNPWHEFCTCTQDDERPAHRWVAANDLGSGMQSPSRDPHADVAPLGVMHLRYIEMFQAILQAGTLTDAASLLNISQPAATKLLKQAERRLGWKPQTTLEAGLEQAIGWYRARNLLNV